MNSFCFLKALIVEQPAMLSFKRLRSGESVTDSTLHIPLWAGIINLYRYTATENITGMITQMRQSVSPITTITEQIRITFSASIPNSKEMVSSRVVKSLENRFIMVPTGVTSKNKLIGAFMTFEIISLWRLIEAFMLITKRSKNFKNMLVAWPAAKVAMTAMNCW